MQITDVLAVVEHEVRGVAATVGTLATLLVDGRLPQSEQRNAFQRLQRASARLEALAADAQALAAWVSGDPASEHRWRIALLSPIVDGAVAAVCETGTTLEPDTDPAAWKDAQVRISADSAFEEAMQTFYDVACKELGFAAPCRVRLVSGRCDVYVGAASGGDWRDERLRTPAELRSRGLKPFVALAVLTLHGVTVWRTAGSDGLGASIPLASPDADPAR